jgi:hypothetical protein
LAVACEEVTRDDGFIVTAYCRGVESTEFNLKGSDHGHT